MRIVIVRCWCGWTSIRQNKLRLLLRTSHCALINVLLFAFLCFFVSLFEEIKWKIRKQKVRIVHLNVKKNEAVINQIGATFSKTRERNDWKTILSFDCQHSTISDIFYVFACFSLSLSLFYFLRHATNLC